MVFSVDKFSFSYDGGPSYSVAQIKTVTVTSRSNAHSFNQLPRNVSSSSTPTLRFCVHLSLQNPHGMRAAPLSGSPCISAAEKQNLQDRVLLTCFSFGHRLLIHHGFSVLLGSAVLNLLEPEDQIGTVPLLAACGLETTHTIVRLFRRYWTRDELFFSSLQSN